MSLLQNSNAIESGSAYTISSSVRFRSSASANLTRTLGTPTNNNVWTLSFWVKRGTLGVQQRFFACNTSNLTFDTGDTITYNHAGTATIVTTALFRDPSAWYHVMLTRSGTAGAGTVTLYINGNSIGSASVTSTGGFNTAATVNYIGQSQTGNNSDGYLSEVYFIDGQALTPSSFGSTNATTGVWQPKKYTGTYGANGFYLNFADNSALTTTSNVGLGKDSSGNGNYYATSGISITAGTTYDSMTDVPTLTSATVANYPTMNSLFRFNANMTYSDGNLTVSETSSAQSNAISTFPFPSSGKWYFECNMVSAPSNTTFVGVIDDSALTGSAPVVNSKGSYRNNGIIYNLAGTSQGGTIATYTTGDVIGVAVDSTNGTVQFYKNNVAQGNTPSFTFTAGTPLYALSAQNNAAGTKTYAFNFGQRPFSYTPPTGYVALNTYNLPNSAVVKGNNYMDATLYTGTGSALTITNAASFKPDLVWIKQRQAPANNNALYDSVRGVTKTIISDTTNAETTVTQSLTSFNTNGFTVGTDNVVNSGGKTTVGWQWQAGQGSTVSNTNGSITSTISANTTTGFSIVTYTGTGANATIGHGLGVAPKMIIFKNRTSAVGWIIYHASIGATASLDFSNSSISTNSIFFNNTSPTSSVFSVGTSNRTNQSTNSMVAYCFTEIAGFSKIDSYTGNGNADGPFIYTGFRPKFVLLKASNSGTDDWCMYDTSRDTYNLAQNYLTPDSSGNESTGKGTLDFLSNGFKLRSTNSSVNTSAKTYVYIAFAENPFKNSLAR
jgi:hypothetical protein